MGDITALLTESGANSGAAHGLGRHQSAMP
jgi:hypothetical protein